MSRDQNFENFQISTDEIHLEELNVSETSRPISHKPSQILQHEDEALRIDNATPPHGHIRAKQLDQFTNWLTEKPASSSSSASITPTPTPAKQELSPESIPQPEPTKEKSAPTKTYRVDAAHQSPRTTIVKKPNFETRDYVADPQDIQRTIQDLKADGRILADQVQESSPAPSQQANKTPITWPRISNRLIGSQAILNLELNTLPVNQTSKHLSVTSAEKGNGATTIAMTLARQHAAHGRRVLLVDADLDDSAITYRLNLQNHASWIQAISDRQSLTDVIIKDQDSPISVLPAKHLSQKINWPRKLVDQLTAMIDSVAWDYELIIYDFGTVQQLVKESTHARNIGDKSLLITGEQVNNSVADAKKLLINHGFQNLLWVQNFSHADQQSNAKVG
ncbi:MAG: AAA family ATPase [Planctomycetota bacterium]